MLWLGQSKAVIGNTIKNTLADPFFLTLHLCGIAFLMLLACLPSYGLSEHTRYFREQGVALNFVFACLAASFILIRNVSDDIRRGAGSVLMSRPISPATLISGKWLGSAICLTLMYASHSLTFLWTTRAASKANIIEATPLVLIALCGIIALLIGAGRHYLFGGGFTLFSNCALPVLLIILFVINFQMNNGEKYDLIFWPAALSLFTALMLFSLCLLPFTVIADAAFILSAATVIFAFGVVSSTIFSKFIPEGYLLNLFEATMPNWQSFWMTDVNMISAPEIPKDLLSKSPEFQTEWQNKQAWGKSIELILQSILRITCLAAFYLPLSVFLFERLEIKGENG